MTNGTRIPIKGVFTNVGTSPLGSTWARLPLPSATKGPRCSCDMDINYKPADFNCGCKMGEQIDACRSAGNCSSGACEPCPETAGSDCSRCANTGAADFAAPIPFDDRKFTPPAVYDQVKVSKLKPGKYVVGFRYACRRRSSLPPPPLPPPPPLRCHLSR